MVQTILVIDSNAAVQAITALALSETGCAIEQLTEGAQALDRIAKLNPVVVLVAKEITGVDPLQLPERMRAASPKSQFVLLAPADGSTALEARANEAGFAAVLFKPFKSNRLREVVTKLLTPAVQVEPQRARTTVVLSLRNKFLLSLFQRIFAGTNAEVLLERPASGDSATVVTIAEWQPDLPLELVGSAKRIWLCTADQVDAARQANPSDEIIKLPFGLAELSAALDGQIAFAPAAPVSPAVAPVGTAHLAARISAAIYERLLLQPALGEKNWAAAAALASAETLRVAESEKL